MSTLHLPRGRVRMRVQRAALSVGARSRDVMSRTLPFDTSTTPAVPGFVSRAIALVIDVFVMALACLFTTLIVAWTGTFLRMGTFSGGPHLVQESSRVAIILVGVFYLPLSWALTGQSIGKAIMGLRVVRRGAESSTERLALWRCFVRGTGYWLSAVPFGLGFLCAALDKEHRALHDRLAGTRVVYQPPKRRIGRTHTIVAVSDPVTRGAVEPGKPITMRSHGS